MKRLAPKRLGMNLLELIIATTMLAVIMVTISTVMRTARQAWEAHAADYSRIEAAHSTIRHIVRQVRQADAVTTISTATDNSGRLAVLLEDGSTVIWDHDGTTNVVNYGVTTANNMLSPDVTGLRFTGFTANGTTTTTTPSQIRAVRIDVTITLPVETNPNRVVSSWAWLRTW